MAAALDWDNVQLFLALSRAGTLREGAAELGISHPTARRRLIRFEQSLGLRLFSRGSDGLVLTPEGHELMNTATAIEEKVHALQRVAAAKSNPAEITARISVTPSLTALIMPELHAYAQRHPEVTLHISETEALVDLGKGDADIALRVVRAGASPQSDLVGRKAAEIYQAVYGEGTRWIGWYGGARDAEWIAKTAFPDAPVGMVMEGMAGQLAACAAGMGLSVLPCFLADAERGLRQRSAAYHGFDIWVLVHPDLRSHPRLRGLRNELHQALKALQPRLRGEGAA